MTFTDPYLLLDLPYTASDEDVRAAYLAALRATPPERDPERFEAIQRAHVRLATQRARIAHELTDATMPSRWELLERLTPRERPGRINPADVLAVLKESSRG